MIQSPYTNKGQSNDGIEPDSATMVSQIGQRAIRFFLGV